MNSPPICSICCHFGGEGPSQTFFSLHYFAKTNFITTALNWWVFGVILIIWIFHAVLDEFSKQFLLLFLCFSSVMHNRFTALWILSTHTYHDHQSSFICFLHLLHSIASSLFNLHVTCTGYWIRATSTNKWLHYFGHLFALFCQNWQMVPVIHHHPFKVGLWYTLVIANTISLLAWKG